MAVGVKTEMNSHFRCSGPMAALSADSAYPQHTHSLSFSASNLISYMHEETEIVRTSTSSLPACTAFLPAFLLGTDKPSNFLWSLFAFKANTVSMALVVVLTLSNCI